MDYAPKVPFILYMYNTSHKVNRKDLKPQAIGKLSFTFENQNVVIVIQYGLQKASNYNCFSVIASYTCIFNLRFV